MRTTSPPTNYDASADPVAWFVAAVKALETADIGRLRAALAELRRLGFDVLLLPAAARVPLGAGSRGDDRRTEGRDGR